VNAARATAPNVTDGSYQAQLTQTTHTLAESLVELRTALSIAQVRCGAMGT